MKRRKDVSSLKCVFKSRNLLYHTIQTEYIFNIDKLNRVCFIMNVLCVQMQCWYLSLVFCFTEAVVTSSMAYLLHQLNLQKTNRFKKQIKRKKKTGKKYDEISL